LTNLVVIVGLATIVVGVAIASDYFSPVSPLCPRC